MKINKYIERYTYKYKIPFIYFQRHHKKKRKSVRNMRRIDILAQPKSMKHELQHKRHLSNVSVIIFRFYCF